MPPRFPLHPSRMQSLIQKTFKLSLTSDKRSQRIEIDGSILEGGGQSKIPIQNPKTTNSKSFEMPPLMPVSVVNPFKSTRFEVEDQSLDYDDNI